MDFGLCSGNYFDYDDDTIAINRESEIAEDLDAEESWEDPSFPADGRSLYFDPLNPPKGSLPSQSLTWFRISRGEIFECDSPKTYYFDRQSSYIRQGALANSYLVNCLRLLASEPKCIQRLIVSDKYAHKGIYTLKFSKYGKWRYVHIDDRIPCRMSGSVHFSRNERGNETFAMLLEKAYAKLHGCYEALVYGLPERCLQDLAPAPHVDVYRAERTTSEDDLCDIVWTKVEAGVTEGWLMSCGRFVPDPYGEKHQDRLGLTLSSLYQVVDVCVASAEATAELDAIDVGLICIRNLQPEPEGRYMGRWGPGHRLWFQYPEIARDISARTREIRSKWYASASVQKRMRLENSGVGGEGEESSGDGAQGMNVLDLISDAQLFHRGGDPTDVRNEREDPLQLDLYWVQIEDFVELFNRLFTVVDLSWNHRESSLKRIVGRWKPGDKRSGSGGPPLEGHNTNSAAPLKHSGASLRNLLQKQSSRLLEDEEDQSTPTGTGTSSVNAFVTNPMYPFSVSAVSTMTICLFQPDRRWTVSRLGNDPRDICVSDYADRQYRLHAALRYDVGIGFAIVRLDGHARRTKSFQFKHLVGSSDAIYYSNVSSNSIRLMPGNYVLVPFQISQINVPMDFIICCRFSTGAMDFEIEEVNDPAVGKLSRKISSKRFGDMSKQREKEKEKEKLIAGTPKLEEGKNEDLTPDGSKKSSTPSRPSIITDNDAAKALLSKPGDDRRLSGASSSDNFISERKPSNVSGPGTKFDMEDMTNNETDQPSSAINIQGSDPVEPPVVCPIAEWEWTEDSEDMGMSAVYDQIADLATFVKSIHSDVRRLYYQSTAAGSLDASMQSSSSSQSKFLSNPAFPSRKQQPTTTSSQYFPGAGGITPLKKSGSIESLGSKTNNRVRKFSKTQKH